MSIYEGLSLAVSTFGTLSTVYIGLRQLRQPVATPAQPAAPVAVAPPAVGPAGGPAGGLETAPQRAAAPAPPGYGASVYGSASVPARRQRPRSVSAASIMLFIAAALNPVILAAYYAIEAATDHQALVADLNNGVVTDVLGFGLLAIITGLLGIFVARGSRFAPWLVWVLGVVSISFCGLSALAGIALAAGEKVDQPLAVVLSLIYVAIVGTAFIVSSILLLQSGARAYFRRAHVAK